MKPKVLHILKSLDIGGTTKSCQLFCRELVARDEFDVFLLYNNNGALDRLPFFREFLDAEHRIGYDSEDEGARFIEEVAPSIVHVYRSGFEEWPEPRVHFNPGRIKFVETNVFGYIDPNPHIHKSLFMSKWLLQAVFQGKHDSQRFDFVNNPVDLPDTDDRMDLGLPEGTVVLGHISRPDPGLFDGLSTDACKILLDRGHKVHYLAVAPPSNLQDALQDIPHTIIESTVNRSTLDKYYNTVDIMLHDRVDGETFGCVLGEQQMAGKPIVTAKSLPKYPGMGCFNNQLEMVDDNVNGFCIGTRDPNEYALKVELLINDADMRNSFGVNAGQKALKWYHTPVVVDKLDSIYKELL